MERHARNCTSSADPEAPQANACFESASRGMRGEASNGPCYWLANLVFVALTRHGAILLDLRRNRYLGVGRAETQMLECVIEDWPTRSSDFLTQSRRIAEKELIDSFSNRGFIRFGPHKPRAIPQTLVRLDGELVAIGDEIDSTARVRISHVLFFFYALVASHLALLFQPIASVIQRAHARRAAAIRNGNDFDWRRASEFVSIFRRIRPYAFVAGGHCLLHALTLVRFLAHYNEFPQLVLGVKVDPWSAHSWVQHGNFLLDTNPEKVCGFTAILAT
jgi:hypothetical protein